jgi:RNA polymerase sigma-70 factor (ECF subfamily)
VKDLVQEITIQVWKAFPRYKTAYKFSTWLYRIALNVAISSYRKEKTRSQINGPMREDFVQIADRSATDQNENIQQLYSLIGKLKSMDRALMLLYLEEKSHAEIAEIMGISSTNVATKISRLKKHLKENFVK